jgi:hypothetical protein
MRTVPTGQGKRKCYGSLPINVNTDALIHQGTQELTERKVADHNPARMPYRLDREMSKGPFRCISLPLVSVGVGAESGLGISGSLSDIPPKFESYKESGGSIYELQNEEKRDVC